MSLSRNLSTLGQAVTTGGNLPSANVTGLAISATINTANASNINSGTLPDARYSTLYTPVGVSQTWSLPTRVAATTYTNSTGRPIVVAISLFYNGQNGGGSATVTVDSVVIQQSQGNNVSGASSAPVHTFIVPNGSTYLLTTTNGGGGAPSISRWAELA